MTSRAIRRGCGIAVAVAVVSVAALALMILIPAWRLPQDAPLARMYRTEADLAVLVKALDTYHAARGVYPPGGAGGLRMATDFLSRTGHYLPEGPPTDGWDRPFVYVPGDAYAAPESQALHRAEVYYAPHTYQVYSLGADGAAGIGDVAQQQDNITSWDSAKPWRSTYQRLNADYPGLWRANQ
ncbi:MAG: type II secretion system protein GspG [Candidatus Hydrogenedentes bacterium]|nr:type II secretion system protein GspG [Candidatus Hydrogenedentota bacterium]